MKRIAAGMMFAALAVVPVLCAQTFTNVAPPSGPPGWTNSTQPPPAWYAVLSYGTNGVVSGTYSNLQLNARGSNEIARLVAAGTNGGGSVIFTNTSAGAWRGDWGQSNANVLATALTNGSFSINGMKVGRGSNLVISAGVTNIESAQSQLSITTNGGTRIINGPYFETEDDVLGLLKAATNTFLPFYRYDPDIDPEASITVIHGVVDVIPSPDRPNVNGLSVFGPDGTNYGKWAYSSTWGIVGKVFGEVCSTNGHELDQYAMFGITTNSGSSSTSGMVWRIQAAGINENNGTVNPQAFLMLDYGNFPYPEMLKANGLDWTNIPLKSLRITNNPTAGQVLTTSNGTNGYWSTPSGGGSVTTNYFLDLPALAGPWNADSTMLGPTTNTAPAFQVLRPFTTSATVRACAVNVAGTNTVQTRSFWGVMRLTASETNWASIAVEHLQTDATTTNQLSFSPLSQTNVLVSGTLTTGTNWIFSGTNFSGWREISVRCDTWHAAGAASTNWLPNIRSARQ